MGKCCINKFIPEEKRRKTCEVCEKPHKNIKNNLCNDCRKERCNDCYIKIDSTYKRCYECNKIYQYNTNIIKYIF